MITRPLIEVFLRKSSKVHLRQLLDLESIIIKTISGKGIKKAAMGVAAKNDALQQNKNNRHGNKDNPTLG